RAYAPEGTEKKPIVFRSRGVMQRSRPSINKKTGNYDKYVTSKFMQNFSIGLLCYSQVKTK
ncbi:MAG: hypothetical protein ACQEQO_02640, partial [Thermodesulfobacteriota bacterium]